MYKFAGDWTSEVPQTHSQREIYAAKGLGITFLVLCGLWLCMLVFLRRRINLAIGLVKEAARAVIAMPFMMVYPFLQAAGAWRSMHTSYVVWTGTKIRRSIHACMRTHASQPTKQQPRQRSTPKTGLLAFLVPWCVFSVYVAAMGHFEPRQFTGIPVSIHLDPYFQRPLKRATHQ